MESPLYQPFPMLPGRRAQLWQHQPQYRRPRHFHQEPEINVVTKGSALLGVGDQTLSLGAGDLVLLHPGQDHVLVSASVDLELFVMALTPELAAHVHRTGTTTTTEFVQLAPDELAETTERLLGLRETHDASALERDLVNLFSQARAQAPRAHVSSRRALQVMERELSVDGERLATRLGTSPSELSRRFHRDLRVPLVEYRARLRLMRFVQLVDGGASFSRAALEANFGSYAQCHRVFSRTLGCSPRDYFTSKRRDIANATL